MSVLAGIAGLLAETGPSRLVTPLSPEAADRAAGAVVEAARLSPAQAGVLMVSSLLISAGMLAWAFWWWRAKSEPAGDVALRLLGRAMGLSAGEREWVRRAAVERGVGAAGLLVSVDALREVARGAGDEVGRRIAARCGNA